jgi:hypothetical protein
MNTTPALTRSYENEPSSNRANTNPTCSELVEPISNQRVLRDFEFGVWVFVSYNIYRDESKRQFEAKRPINTLFNGEILIWEDGEANSYSC